MNIPKLRTPPVVTLFLTQPIAFAFSAAAQAEARIGARTGQSLDLCHPSTQVAAEGPALQPNARIKTTPGLPASA